MRFSSEEAIELLKAWAALSIAFGAVLSGVRIFSSSFLEEIASIQFAQSVLISALTVGVGFLLHELAHKFLAQRYGCRAEFRAFDSMLYLSVFMAFAFNFVFAVPGAVFILSHVNTARNGRISAVGPLVNIVLSLAFFAMLVLFAAAYPSELLLKLAYYGLSINAWLGVFNLLPIWQLDGAKVLAWNKKVYVAMMAAAITVMVLSRMI